jgi:hydroxyquinol 1,2-dioxygenase
MEVHEKGFFTEDNSVDVVISRNARAKNERLKQVLATITRKLHEAAKEIEPTQEEWMTAILFLTNTGHMSDDWRQEFILLSDVLGLSMLVDAINNRKPSGASESTVLGPFYVADAPQLPMGANICLDRKGEDMVSSRRLASQRRRLLRRSAEGDSAGLQPTRRLPHRTGRALLVPGREAALLSHS